MKKFFVIFLIFCGLFSADVLPYKPQPIIFVHGLGGSSGDWGAGTYKIGEVKTDSIHPDSVIPGSSYSHFLNDFMLHYVWVLDTLGYDTSLTIPGGLPNYPNPDPAYPNKTFLEVINFEMRDFDSNGFARI